MSHSADDSLPDGEAAPVGEMRQALALFTEYQLATLEGLPARASARERRRHQGIADEMVAACRKFGVVLPHPMTPHALRAPRLRLLLEQP